jgi:hypothetical protein
MRGKGNSQQKVVKKNLREARKEGIVPPPAPKPTMIYRKDAFKKVKIT